MTKKYTPGPWEIVESRNDSYGNVKDCPIWIKGDDWVLASIVDDVEYIDGEANARLIVLAPELLEALEVAMDYINNCPCDPDIYPEQWKVWKMLCKIDIMGLIKRAKGEV